jgi:predicted nicotinamide N-methyase
VGPPVDWSTWIQDHTVVDSPVLCPEIRLHLITEACELWRATERDLTAAGIFEPYWAFCWAGGQALARFVLDHPERVRGRRVLDFGAGGGVEAIAAARAGAARVLGSDIDPLAEHALHRNAALNGVTLETTTRDLIGDPCDEWEVILAGDVCYERALTERILGWFGELVRAGKQVLVADPHRGYLAPERLELLACYKAPSDVDVGGKFLRDTAVYRVVR